MNMTFRPVSTEPISHSVRRPCCTFAKAAESYLTKHPREQKYIEQICMLIGNIPFDQLVPYDLREMAIQLYPTQSNATRNRCFLTPIKAVWYHAADREWAQLKRIKSFREDRPRRKKAASQAWLHAFMIQADKDGLPHIADIVLFMSQTGARVSEALNVRWRDMDLSKRMAILTKTKTEVDSPRFYTSQLADRLYPRSVGRAPGDRAFQIKNRSDVNDRIKQICGRAGIKYKSSHLCGRHAFATNSIELGLDVKSVMVAGGWKSANIFLGTYVNPRNAGRAVAERMDLYQYENDL